MNGQTEPQLEKEAFPKHAKDTARAALAITINVVCGIFVALALSGVLAAVLYFNGFMIPDYLEGGVFSRGTTATTMVMLSVLAAGSEHLDYLMAHGIRVPISKMVKHAIDGVAIFSSIMCLPWMVMVYPVVVGLTCCALVAVFARRAYPKMRERRFAKTKCAVKSFVAAAECMAVAALVVVGLSTISGFSFASGTVGQDTGMPAGGEEEFQLGREVLSNVWQCASLPNKVDKLQAVVHLESEYLHIEEPRVVLTFCAKGKMSAYHPSTNTIELNAVYAALPDGQYSLDSVFFEAMNAYQCRVATEGHKSSDPVQFSETELEEIRSGVEKVRRTDTTDQKRIMLIAKQCVGRHLFIAGSECMTAAGCQGSCNG